MGTDFKCGCRVSGAWYLCEKHEDELIAKIELLGDEDDDDDGDSDLSNSSRNRNV